MRASKQQDWRTNRHLSNERTSEWRKRHICLVYSCEYAWMLRFMPDARSKAVFLCYSFHLSDFMRKVAHTRKRATKKKKKTNMKNGSKSTTATATEVAAAIKYNSHPYPTNKISLSLHQTTDNNEQHTDTHCEWREKKNVEFNTQLELCGSKLLCEWVRSAHLLQALYICVSAACVCVCMYVDICGGNKKDKYIYLYWILFGLNGRKSSGARWLRWKKKSNGTQAKQISKISSPFEIGWSSDDGNGNNHVWWSWFEAKSSMKSTI